MCGCLRRWKGEVDYRDATASKNKKIECAFLWALERDKEGRLVEG